MSATGASGGPDPRGIGLDTLGTPAALPEGMQSRFVLYSVLATLFIGGFAFVADALVVSDEEHLGELAEAVTEGDGQARVDAAMRWMDLSRAEVTVRQNGSSATFDEGDGFRLQREVEDALSAFRDPDAEVVQRSVDVDGERATVAVRVRTGGAAHDASFHLVRSGQGWLVERLSTR